MGATSAPREIPFRESIARAVLPSEGKREGGIRTSSSPTLPAQPGSYPSPQHSQRGELFQPPGELRDLAGTYTRGESASSSSAKTTDRSLGFSGPPGKAKRTWVPIERIRVLSQGGGLAPE